MRNDFIHFRFSSSSLPSFKLLVGGKQQWLFTAVAVFQCNSVNPLILMIQIIEFLLVLVDPI